MPLVHAADLLDHARNTGYRVAAFELASLDHIVLVIEAAERAAAPVMLTFVTDDIGRSLVPALAAAVAVARAATVPVVIEVRAAPDDETVASAIRGGANCILLCPTANAAPERIEAAVQVARASGVPLFVVDAGSTAVVGPADPGSGYRDYGRLPATPQAACAEAERFINECGASNRAAQALSACRAWREVEHLILYNVRETGTSDFVENMMAQGHAILGRIPGVRHVITGRALRADARYRYCWFVRFTSPAVVENYRGHPDHVSFADGQFRPVASDRISIDFEVFEPNHEKH